MNDIADDAFERQSLIERVGVEHVTSKIKRGPSLSECRECGEPISEQRQALGGVELCVDCQEDEEKRNQRL